MIEHHIIQLLKATFQLEWQQRRKASHANDPGLVRIWKPVEDIRD